MNQHENTTSKSVTQPRSGWRWAAAIAGVIAVVSLAGVSYANGNMSADGQHGWYHHHHAATPEDMAKHIDHVVDHILADGSAEQKSKVKAIAQSALNDLKPLREQHHAAHQEVVKLLTQANIDRRALEQVRTSEMRLAEQVSKRITQAVADAAEVLTPEQRVKLSEHIKQRMG